MAKICRVLEKLRQLRTDQLRKSGSVLLCFLSIFFTIKDSRGLSWTLQVSGVENIDICFTFEGGCCRHQDQQTPQKQQNKPSVCFTARFKPLQWAKLDELRNLRSFVIYSPKILPSQMNYQSEVNFFGVWKSDGYMDMWRWPYLDTPLISWVANFSPPDNSPLSTKEKPQNYRSTDSFQLNQIFLPKLVGLWPKLPVFFFSFSDNSDLSM